MFERRLLALTASLALAAAHGAPAQAAEVYFRVPLRQLSLAGGDVFPAWESNRFEGERSPSAPAAAFEPRAVLDAPGEVYVDAPDRSLSPWQKLEQGVVVIRLDAPGEAKGRLFVPAADWMSIRALRFVVPAASASPDARTAFLEAKHRWHEDLAARGVPGAAWFRHIADGARRELAGSELARAPLVGRGWGRPRASELEETYAIFSGGRALAENLQLDRLLPAVSAQELTVDVATLAGISVAAIDWAPLVKDLKPTLDPLAAAVPEDQHALFFPSFAAMVELMEEADASGTPILQLVEPRAEDHLTRERYERQLCLGVSDVARLLGPAVVDSAAFTGSDPFLRMGTDVAVLFAARTPEALVGYIDLKQTAALKAHPGTERREGEAGGLRYRAVVSPDRVVSSYVASRGTTVVVSNSRVQLERIGDAMEGRSKALSASDEYRFFRNRYPRGAGDEKGLLILTDATIRRWCGPVWRIGDSRRTRAAAALAEIRARCLERVARGEDPGSVSVADLEIPAGGVTTIQRGVPRSSVYGSLDFLTPIAELSVAKASAAEASAYKRFRDTYQQNWRAFFDPIAVSFSARNNRIELDLTVMPLIEATEYKEVMDVTRDASIPAAAGDPHAEALLHVVLGVNPKSQTLLMLERNVLSFLPGVRANPLSWLGGAVSVYADDDPVWQEIQAQPGPERVISGFLPRLPLALHAESRDPLALAAFLAALRAFIETSAPGMTSWDVRSHRDRSYVRVSASERAKAEQLVPSEAQDIALYYAVGGGGLTLSLGEALIHRALDRQAERAAAKQDGATSAAAPAATPWLGESVAVRADQRAIHVLAALGEGTYRREIQARAWASIPVLNEWKRLFPAEDPLKLHERMWGVRLLCPGGGAYVWNDEAATVESTVYGHPGRPKPGPDAPQSVLAIKSAAFGLTFEKNGLRARVALERQAAHQRK